MADDQPKVKSLYKAIKLLDHFTFDNPERGIRELADLSGMLKSSVHNVMQTLQLCGIIEKGSVAGRYRLGYKLLELGNVLMTNDEAQRVVKSFTDRLAEECGETVYYAVPYGPEIIYLECSHPKGIQFTRSVLGVKAEMHCTSLGKAILAFSGEELLRQALGVGLRRYTPYTITDEAALRRELEKIRERGHAVDNMEHEYGIRCVGVPVRDRRGDVVGAISISGPSLRVMDDKLAFFAERLHAAAKELQPLLGH